MSQAKKILKDHFGYDEFRPLQGEIINRVLDKKDSLVLMPTGGGKSICFQIPALIFEGITLVISPLISLMKDQVEALKVNGIKAEYLNSSQTSEEENRIRNLVETRELKLLYLSPEKLLSEGGQWLSNIELSMVAVDEAHCVSMWGHDFRREYTQLRSFRESRPETPFIALTATADKATRKDIVKQLGLINSELFISSFDRKNLSLEVRPNIKKKDKIQEYIQFIGDNNNESGIIYCLSRKETENIASKLNEVGIDAIVYHAGLDRETREKNQEQFIRDESSVVCATIAFGMGIDKSNVRWVIHNNLPKNIEGFYQEIGRAGRDGLPSTTLLYYNLGDLVMLGRFAQESSQSEILMGKLRRMQEYCESSTCRRRVLLSYFGEHLVDDCGNCDVCKNPPTFFDGRVIGQKALSAVIRTREKVGTNMLINVLRGSGNRELMEKNYHEIKTYGAGKEHSYNDWKSYIIQMLNQGVFEIAYDDAFTLKVTSIGKSLLTNEGNLRLTIPVEKETKAERKKAGRKTKKSTVSGEVPAELFEKLRSLRGQIAKKLGMPAYIIFHDSTLKEMSQTFPTTEAEMLDISGVSNVKANKYGPAFLAVIKENLSLKPKPKSSTHDETYSLYKDNLTPEEIADKKGIKVATVFTHLIKLKEDGKDIDLTQYTSNDVIDKVKKAKGSLKGDSGLRDYFVFLNEEVPYDDIKIALGVLG
ncbi:MAG: ATP-dependent DNA helicase RecQ [Patiriisocius sp.]|jgi:ATP-dependent DNA helicase RecQ